MKILKQYWRLFVPMCLAIHSYTWYFIEHQDKQLIIGVIWTATSIILAEIVLSKQIKIRT